ncbi:MAG: hypothetical protein ACI395_09425 [Candidatus Cryptobacteroides sp.]
MKKILLPFLLCLMSVSCARTPVLPRDNWNDKVYDALCNLIETQGIKSECYDTLCRPYAVFDFDNTTVMNDISITLMIYQIENLRYAFSPEEAFSVFTAWLPDLDTVMTGVGLTARQLGERLAADYKVLHEKRAAGATLEELHCSGEYLDFRARLMALNDGVEYTCDYGTWCLWMPALFSGMSYGELQDLTKESVAHWTSLGRIWTEHWESPDGEAASDVMKGLVLPQESVNLYKALSDNGFDVYICSASLEAIVEAMACDPQYGLALSPERVFGIRLEDGPGSDFARDYDQTFLEGKTACINRLIAPSHCGRQPSLVAGDSNGDYDMLTAFDGLKTGLLIDCGRSGDIAALIERARHQDGTCQPCYAVQSRDLSVPGYVR